MQQADNNPTTTPPADTAIIGFATQFGELALRLEVSDAEADTQPRNEEMEERGFALYDELMSVFERIASIPADGLKGAAIKAQLYRWVFPRHQDCAQTDELEKISLSLADDLMSLSIRQ
jgi:hypothetical protein